MRYDIQKILLPPLQRRQIQDGYMVLRKHDTSLPRLSTWQGVRLPLHLHWTESIWRWRSSPRLVRHPSIHYLVGKRERLDPTLNQLKLARTILFKAHLCMGVPTGCFPFGFSYQNCTSCISPLNDSPPPILTCFGTNFEVPHYAIVSILLFPSQNILYTLFSNTFSLRSFNCINDEVGPYLTTAHNLPHYRFNGTRSLLMFCSRLLQVLHSVHTTRLCWHRHSLSRPHLAFLYIKVRWLQTVNFLLRDRTIYIHHIHKVAKRLWAPRSQVHNKSCRTVFRVNRHWNTSTKKKQNVH